MASKRSRVQQLQRVSPATPVARPVDTFVQYRPPAKKPNTGTELLRALSEVSPTLAKIAQGNKDERVAQEKAKIDDAFFKDPEQFAKDVADGKYANFSSPAQVLAGENMGKRLAIQYGAYLNQEYASQGIGNSKNAADFVPFEDATRQRFVANNSNLFGQLGVTQGFVKAIPTYTSGLASTHNSKATSNLIEGQKADYATSVELDINSFVFGRLTADEFATQIKLDEGDTKFVSGLSNVDINNMTVDTIVEMSKSDAYTFDQRRLILNSARLVSTRDGFNLTDNINAASKLGEAHVALDKAIEKDRKASNALYEEQRTNHERITEQKIVDALAASPDPSELDLEDILTAEELEQDDYFLNQSALFFSQQQNFFEGEAGEVDGDALINMRIKVAGAKTPEDARKMIVQFQEQGMLNDNPAVFATLWSDAKGIEKAKELNLPSFTGDDNYKINYGDILLKFGMKEDVITGDLIVYEELPEGISKQVQEIRNQYITMFKREFLSLYYSDQYLQASYAEKSTLANNLYDNLMTRYNNAVKKN